MPRESPQLEQRSRDIPSPPLCQPTTAKSFSPMRDGSLQFHLISSHPTSLSQPPSKGLSTDERQQSPVPTAANVRG